MVSHPTMSRKLLAAALIIVGFGLTVVVKLVRNDTDIFGPVWIANALPNFICGAVLPLAVFMSQRTVRLFDLSLFAGFILIGLGLYEAAQIWMPKRTAEWIDVQASAVGTLTAIGIGLMFFRWDATGEEKLSEPALEAKFDITADPSFATHHDQGDSSCTGI